MRRHYISNLFTKTILTVKFYEYSDLKNACSLYDCFPHLSLWTCPLAKLGGYLSKFLFFCLCFNVLVYVMTSLW